jgi:hydroxyacylglutathione hydrolase
MPALEIRQFPCLDDNYGYLVHDPETGETAAIDTPDVAAYLEAAKAAGWRITQIWNTHHHYDHAGGNLALKEATGARICGPGKDAARIPGLEQGVVEGDLVRLGSKTARVLETPGHTTGHIVYVFDADRVAFVGDTMFALGCGRLFEGTPAVMWPSLEKLLALPDDTTVYCAHEYTQSNARFALSIEPGNAALQARAREIDAARAAGRPTVPTSIGLEKATSPFVRPQSPEIRARFRLEEASDVDVFGAVRKAKDMFKG